MWYEITYPFPNFNGATVEVWERVSNFIPHYTEHAGIKIKVSKRGPSNTSLVQHTVARATMR